MCLYGSAELVPVAVFCILNSLSQISFKEGKRGVAGGGAGSVGRRTLSKILL